MAHETESSKKQETLEKKAASEMRRPGVEEKPETGGIKRSLFTLLFTYLILAEDIDMSDLTRENTDKDGEDASDPELKEINVKK